jgi:AAA+ superfamily predicted ATPase
VPLDLPTETVDFAALARALKVLDGVLAIAVEKQARLLGPATLLDPWRGMHLDRSDVERLLHSSAHVCLSDAATQSIPELLAAALCEVPRASSLACDLSLSAEDLAALLIALAPDVDLRYERIYAYLQDDIARKRPSLDLMANLLARDTAERLFVCSRFGGSAPLRRYALLARSGSSEAGQLSQAWRVDELWRRWLLGDDDVSQTIGAGATLLVPSRVRLQDLPLEPSAREWVQRAIEAQRTRAIPLKLWLQGPHGSGKYSLAHAVAGALSQKLLVLDVRHCAATPELRARLHRAHRAAILFNAVLYIHGLASLEDRSGQMLRALIEALARCPCAFILSVATALAAAHTSALPVVRIAMSYPGAGERREIWSRALEAGGAQVSASTVDQIAMRFSLNAPQIMQAAAETCARAMLADRPVEYEHLAAAVRAQCGTELARIAQRIAPRADFSTLIVPFEVHAQLREICARVGTRQTVGRQWARGSVHARATGVTVLFVGPSGTGKTLSAEALARELALDLYRIDLAGIVSKYIGETEKNLDRVFAAAENANAVLFFDEADALFGKRSEVKDAHDRYANIEVAYLLQKMEQFDGLAILATNLKQNLDEAFARRLTFTVNFPFPEEPERIQLWEKLWPPLMSRHEDVDLAWFAREFRLSGGNIRNAVLAAAHLAAADGRTITRAHLLRATRREYQKLGKNLVHPAMSEVSPG